MAWNFLYDRINKGTLSIVPSASTDSTNLAEGCLVWRTSNLGRPVGANSIMGTSGIILAGSTADACPNRNRIIGICVSGSTLGSTALAAIAPVMPLELLVVDVSTVTGSTYITSSNIGKYVKAYNTSCIDGSTGVNLPASSDDSVAILAGFSTAEGKAYVYIPNFFIG